MKTLSMTLLLLLTLTSLALAQEPPEGAEPDDAPSDLAPVESADDEAEAGAAAAVPLTGPQAELAAILARIKAEPALLQIGSEADLELKRLADGPNGLIEALYDRGVFHLRLNNLDVAHGIFQETLSKDPNFSEAVAQLGIIASMRNELDKARALIDQALTMDKYCAPARDYYSRKALNEGNLDETIKHCRIALLGDPDNLNAYLNMAIAYYRKGQLDVGELVAQSALRIDKDNAPILNLIGLIHLKKDDVKGAITMFQAAVTADPEFMDARKNLASVTLNFKDFATAEKQLQAVLQREPDNIQFLISRAVALRGMEEFDEAQKVLQGVLTKQPRHPEATYNLCILLHEYLQDYGKALSVCTEFQASLDSSHSKFKEMKLRTKGIAETMKIMEEMKQLEKDNPREEVKPEEAKPEEVK